MPKLVVVNRAGEESTVEASAGLSVMEAIRDNGFDELLALCGGCCSCATCHVHVDAGWIGKLAPMSDDENDLLVLVVQELVGEDQKPEEGTVARFWASREQMLTMGRYALQTVAAGRPICGNCGQPIDPEGHFCPRRNGHPPIGYIP